MAELETESLVTWDGHVNYGSSISSSSTEGNEDVVVTASTSLKLNEDSENNRRAQVCFDNDESMDFTGRLGSINCLDDALTSSVNPVMGFDPSVILQARVLVEDAAYYRSIHHRLDPKSLSWYRFYYSWPVRWLTFLNIFVILMLAFLEYPSSLSISSDVRQNLPRIEFPCGVTESVEMVCLVLFTVDLCYKAYLVGWKHFLCSRWLLAYVLVLAISYVDWSVSVIGLCTQTVRVRRLLRPFFLLQNSSLMKKAFNCLRRTLPDIFSVLLLLLLHLFIFTLFGLLIFPTTEIADSILPANESEPLPLFPGSNQTGGSDEQEGDKFFPNFPDALVNLLVLLTTANNPDVMMPSYQSNRFYALYFIVFLIIGLYCLMNMLTAVVYNQFRGYFLTSIQASVFRRKVGIRAAYEVLRNHGIPDGYEYHERESVSSSGVREVVRAAKIHPAPKQAILTALDERPGDDIALKEFNDIFRLLDHDYSYSERPDIIWVGNRYIRFLQRVGASRAFTNVGTFIAFVNVTCITVEVATEYDRSINQDATYLGKVNMAFTGYYALEQALKMWSLGFKRYFWELGNGFDCLVIILLVLAEILYLTFYGLPVNRVTGFNDLQLYDMVRLVNMLIIVRLLRIIPQIKMMSLVACTLRDLFRNLRAFAGILSVLYYIFALVGMELFEGKIKADFNITREQAYECGSYQQLDYWANNFDDFAASLVVLWDIMVQNNWFVFLKAYSQVTSRWSQIYFAVWWLVSVNISLNLFTAIILENFIMRWDRSQPTTERSRVQSIGESTNPMTIHAMFRGMMSEPAENDLVQELRHHHHHNFGFNGAI